MAHVATLTEISTSWSLNDLVDAHRALDHVEERVTPGWM